MSTTTPEFPMQRAARCPFDPPPALRDLQDEGPLAQVQLSDGSTAWLVSRYADQRAVLGKPKVSAEPDRPGYPNPNASEGEGSKISFIRLSGAPLAGTACRCLPHGTRPDRLVRARRSTGPRSRTSGVRRPAGALLT